MRYEHIIFDSAGTLLGTEYIAEKITGFLCCNKREIQGLELISDITVSDTLKSNISNMDFILNFCRNSQGWLIFMSLKKFQMIRRNKPSLIFLFKYMELTRIENIKVSLY